MAENGTINWKVGHMRKTFSSLVLAGLCGGLLLWQAGCQQQTSDKATPAAQVEPEKAVGAPVTPAVTGTPRIEAKIALISAGDIGPETRHKTQFPFKNVGDAPLKILQVKGCCGSSTHGVEAGDEYAPGEGGALEVEYVASAYPGPLVRNFSITTNDPDHPVTTFEIKANVILFVECSPARLSLFAKRENAGCGPITLKSVDGKPFAVTGFRSTANTIKAPFDPDVTDTQFVLTPTVDVEKLKHSNRGQISIDLTHPECKNIRILYDLTPEFVISPPQLTLFNLKPNQPIRREIWVMSNYEEDFEIESVSSQRDIIKVVDTKKVPAAPKGTQVTVPGAIVNTGGRYQLQIEITPPAPGDDRSILSDVLEVKIKGGETLTLQCRGFYAG
jgi:hypothetical protein